MHKYPLLLTALFAWSHLCFSAESEKEFKPLFNGKDLTGWHFSGGTGVRFRGWQVVGGVLENRVRKREGVLDLLSDSEYWNFTLRLEFMIPSKSNSGVFLRDRHEIQMFGDYDSHVLNAVCNGAIYNFATPKEFVSRPGIEWQQLEVTIIEHEITVTLNGTKIHDRVKCEIDTRNKSTRNVNTPGPLRLQGTLGNVSFRNIRIKELPGTQSYSR